MRKRKKPKYILMKKRKSIYWHQEDQQEIKEKSLILTSIKYWMLQMKPCMEKDLVA